MFDGVENVALESVLEPARRDRYRIWSRERDWTFRQTITDQVQGRMIRVQFT